MGRNHTIRINEYGMAEHRPGLKREGRNGWQVWHVADRMEVLQEDGSRKPVSMRKGVSRIDLTARHGRRYFDAPGAFVAADVEKGDVVAITGERNLLVEEETVDPEPKYMVVLEKTADALKVHETESLPSAIEVAAAVRSGKSSPTAEVGIGR